MFDLSYICAVWLFNCIMLYNILTFYIVLCELDWVILSSYVLYLHDANVSTKLHPSSSEQHIATLSTDYMSIDVYASRIWECI